MEATVDLETLGTTPDSVILTVGAVKFKPNKIGEIYDKFYVKLDIDFQMEQLGRVVNDDTLDWWSKQNPAVREDALSESDRISCEEFVREFNRYCVGVDGFWAQGAAFDFILLEDLYRNMGEPFPINYYQLRDSRTLFKFFNYDPRKQINSSQRKAHHNALDDAESQSIALQQLYQEFDIERTVG